MDLKEKIAIIHNLMRVNKFTQAIIDCHKLIKLHPNVSYLYNLCGMAYQGNNQIKKSIESFNLALHYDSENLAAMNNLANSYKALNHNDKAEEIYKKVLKKDPNNIKCLNNFANLMKKLRDFNLSKELLLRAVEIESNNVDILFAHEDEIKAQCETDSFDKAVEYAKSLNMIVAITRSADGSVIVNKEEVIEINPVQVDRVVDTTGAGDLYAGGFLFGMAKEKDLTTCGNYASIAAAEIISHYGARPLVKLSNLI